MRVPGLQWPGAIIVGAYRQAGLGFGDFHGFHFQRRGCLLAASDSQPSLVYVRVIKILIVVINPDIV